MIYLVGGAPRVGKSQFMQKVIEQRPMPAFSCDFLYELEQVKGLAGFSGADILEKVRSFYPTLKQLLMALSQRSEHCIIEGEVILPEFIPELAKQYDIRCCFLGLSATNMQTILEHGGYFNWPQWKLDNDLGHEVEQLAERTIARSKIIEAEAAKYVLPYYDLYHEYELVTRRAIEELLN